MVVGDSITHFNMLQAVNKVDDLAIAFNANEHVPECATMSFVSAGSDDLWMVLETREKGGCHGVEKAVKAKEAAGGIGDRKRFHWIAGTKDITLAPQIHQRIRGLVKEEAAKLG